MRLGVCASGSAVALAVYEVFGGVCLLWVFAVFFLIILTRNLLAGVFCALCQVSPSRYTYHLLFQIYFVSGISFLFIYKTDCIYFIFKEMEDVLFLIIQNCFFQGFDQSRLAGRENLMLAGSRGLKDFFRIYVIKRDQ